MSQRSTHGSFDGTKHPDLLPPRREIDVQAGDQLLRTIHLSWEALGPGVAEIGGKQLETRRRYARVSHGRVWGVHTAEAPAPAGKRRARKAVGGTTPLGAAIPLH